MANVSQIWKENVNNRDKDGAMCYGCEPIGTSEILEDASVEPIAMVMRGILLEWFGHIHDK